MITRDARQKAQLGAAMMLCAIGIYLVVKWFGHFNGLSRMFFGMIGLVSLGTGLILVPSDPTNAFTLWKNSRTAVGWAMLVFGLCGAAFLMWFAYGGGI